MALLEGPPVIAEDLFKVSRSIRCLVGAIEHGWTTSSHPDPPGYAPSSDSLLFVFPGGTRRRGDAQKRKFLYAQDTVGSAHASFSNRLWPLRVVVMVSRSDASSPETPLPRPSTLARPPDASATSWQASTIRLMRSSCSLGGRTESPTLMTSVAVSKSVSSGRSRSHLRSWAWAGERSSTPRMPAKRRTVWYSRSVTSPLGPGDLHEWRQEECRGAIECHPQRHDPVQKFRVIHL